MTTSQFILGAINAPRTSKDPNKGGWKKSPLFLLHASNSFIYRIFLISVINSIFMSPLLNQNGFSLLSPTGSYGASALEIDRICTNMTTGEPKFCYPEFVDFMTHVRHVNVNSTCGREGIDEFCVIAEDNSTHCDFCSDSEKMPHLSRNASKMVDMELYINKTFWVSELRPKKNVEITLSFNKTFEIFYIIIHFQTVMPTSFSIEKSVDMGRIWTPYQYYSSDCKGVYGIEPNQDITRQNEQEAICTSLDRLPSKRKAYFSTIDKRPSGTTYQSSPVLLVSPYILYARKQDRLLAKFSPRFLNSNLWMSELLKRLRMSDEGKVCFDDECSLAYFIGDTFF